MIRDRIPEIVERTGKKCKTRVLDDDEYLKELDKKLLEETNEYLESGELEELADVMETLRAILRARSISWEELERARETKRRERGGFDERLLLLRVD